MQQPRTLALLFVAATTLLAVSAFVPPLPSSIVSTRPSTSCSPLSSSSSSSRSRRPRTSTALQSISLDSFFGKRPQDSASSSSSNTASATTPITIMEVQRQDLRIAASVCIESFFGTAEKLNPIRSMQLATLLDEQFADLRSRFGGRAVGGSVFLQAVDEDGQIQGVVEIGVTQSMKWGFEQYGVPVRDERPYLANLSVRPGARRQGIGRALVQACEELVQNSWGFDELILQVEDTNKQARKLYRELGYVDLYTDATGRKYELSGMSIKNVRINKVTLRKPLASTAAVKNPLNSLAAMWSQLSLSTQG